MKLEQLELAGGVLSIRLFGELDAIGAGSLREQLEKLAELDRDLVLDLSGVSFLDSSGVGAIVFLFKRVLARGHRMSLAAARGQPLELLELLRMGQAIPMMNELPASAPEGGVSCAP